MAGLDILVQEGLLVDRTWLRKHGIHRSAADYYLRSGKLEAVARGIYRKPGPPLKWQNIVYSLNQLGYGVHVGHETALEYHGFAHFLGMGKSRVVKLYSQIALPKWIGRIDMEPTFHVMTRNPFEDSKTGVSDIPFGTWDWPIPLSSPERAFIELMSSTETKEEISKALMMMEGAGTLRPGLLQSLLSECHNIKAKRLFLWMARTTGHSWYKRLDVSGINLGTGKRQIVPAGILDKEFQITVPREDSDGQNEPLF